MYALTNELKAEKIAEALGSGKSFIAFEVYGLAQDFSFSASDGNAHYDMGDSINTQREISLTVKAPKESLIRLIHNGKTIEEKNGKLLERKVSEPGYYRAEVYMEGKLWIVSNPIYISRSAPESIIQSTIPKKLF